MTVRQGPGRFQVVRPMLLALILAAAACATTKTTISPAEAQGHVGERATVCGTVASSKFASRTRGQPTFLNLDQPYPNPIFTVVIWGGDRIAFGEPEKMYAGKRITVTGRIQEYRGRPQMVIRAPGQISLAEE